MIIVAVFATRAILNNNSSDNQQTNNASNDNNVSKDYKNEVQNQSDNIKQQVEDAKMTLRIKSILTQELNKFKRMLIT